MLITSDASTHTQEWDTPGIEDDIGDDIMNFLGNN